MIEIHWLWIPFIVLIFFVILSYIFEDPKISTGPITFITGIIGVICLVIYFIAVIWWLFTNVKILT